MRINTWLVAFKTDMALGRLVVVATMTADTRGSICLIQVGCKMYSLHVAVYNVCKRNMPLCIHIHPCYSMVLFFPSAISRSL